MKKFLVTTTTFACLAVLAAAPALAIPLSGTFTVNVFQGKNPNPGSSTDATQQALPSAVTAITTNSTYISPTFTYTGPLALSAQTAATGYLDTFFASAGGKTSIALPHSVLSSGGFADETLIEFSYATNGTTSGTITHDDGISIFADNSPTNLLPGNSAPTSATATPFTNAPGGLYHLYYSEVNGTPATINVDITKGNATVPEPMSMALLGSGLMALGFIRRKTRA